jgi:hypothetical protein
MLSLECDETLSSDDMLIPTADSGENMQIPTAEFKNTVFTFAFTFLKQFAFTFLKLVFEEHVALEVVSDAACICFHVVHGVCGKDGDTFFTDHVFWEDGAKQALIEHSFKLVLCSLGIAFKLYFGRGDVVEVYNTFLLTNIAMRVTEKCESTFVLPNQAIRLLRSRLKQLTVEHLLEFEKSVFMWNCNSQLFSLEEENAFRNAFILFMDDSV